MSGLNWPFTGKSAIKIQSAEGVYLYTEKGREIIDAAGGAIVSNVGHGRQRVADAVAEATKACTYVVPPWITPGRERMLDVLAQDWIDPIYTRMHGTSGGTEANEAAMKMALQYQQAIGETARTKILGRSIGYHGTTLATASISGHPARKRGLEGALAHYPKAQTPYALRCPLGSHHADAGAFYADDLRATIEREGPETIAALLAEPITGSSGGALVPPDDYWPQVREICDEMGIVLIMDEVMTGFGRTGKHFGHQHWPIKPDIFLGGKGLAGGYAPLCGVFATEAIGAAIDRAGYPVMFNTFGAHPAACAAAAEVLQIMIEEELIDRAATMGDYLHTRLQDAFSNHPHIAEVRGKGLLQAIEIVKDRESLERYPAEDTLSAQVVANALDKGVFFYGGGTGTVRDVVCMGPAFTINEAQIDQCVAILCEAVDEVTQAT